MERPAFVIFVNSSAEWEFELYLEDGKNILHSFDNYPNHDRCLWAIKFIQHKCNSEGPGQWESGWAEDGERFWCCLGTKGKPIADTLYTVHNNMHDFETIPSLLYEKIKIAQIIYYEPLTNPIWAEESNNKLLSTIFLLMMTNQNENVYYNKMTKDIQQETNGYLSSNLAEDQNRENTILMNRILQNGPQDDINPEIHFLIPRVSLESFCSTLKDRGFDISQLGSFIDDFIEVQRENSSQSEIYFNEYRTNLLLSQLNEWCADTGTDVNFITKLFDETGKIHAIRFLEKI